MSTHAHTTHPQPGHGHGGHSHGGYGHGHGAGGHGNHGDHHDDGHAHGTFGSYMIGFVLSVILTAIPFWMVMTGTFDNTVTSLAIMALAAVQIVVHMIYFLHMNGRAEGGWSLLAMIFTIIIVVITLAGSLWVMYHLNTNMMPMPDMRQLP